MKSLRNLAGLAAPALLCLTATLFAITTESFGPTGGGGTRNNQEVTFGNGGTVFEIDAFLYVDGIDLNGGFSGTSAQLSVDSLPTGLDYSFNSTLDANATLLTLTYSFANSSQSPFFDLRFFFFIDAEIRESENTFFNEFVTVTGNAGNGLLDREIDFYLADEPGFQTGQIIDLIRVGSLPNNNLIPQGQENDVSLAVGFELGDLLPGKSGDVTIYISESGEVRGDLGLTHEDADQASNTTLTLSAEADLLQPVPQVTAPPTASTDEDTLLAFAPASFVVTFEDSGVPLNVPLQLSLEVLNGTLDLASVANVTLTTGDGSDDPLIVMEGLPDALNAVLEGVTYNPVADFNTETGSNLETLNVTVQDLNGVGVSGLPFSDTTDISVLAVNDAPALAGPANVSTDEDNFLLFSANDGNLITLSDVDANEDNGGNLTLSLLVGNGTLSLNSLAGLIFNTGDGVDDPEIEIEGPLSALLTALEDLSYQPNSDFNTETGSNAESLDLLATDLGNTGLGGVLNASLSIPITVNAINDDPALDVPGVQTVAEDNSLVLSGGNAISIGDLDYNEDNGGPLLLTLAVGNGTLSLATNVSLTFSTGDGVDDATMTFEGMEADINLALDGLTYTPAQDFNTETGGNSEGLVVSLNDQGHTGTGGGMVVQSTIPITVTAVNDDPTVTAPTFVTVTEDTPFLFSGGNLLSVNDVDASEDNGGEIVVSLSVSNGTLSASASGSAQVNGSPSDSISISGTVANINDTLATLTYAPPLNFNADGNGPNSPPVLTFTVNDNGHTGTGGNLTDLTTISVRVLPVNDRPGITGPTNGVTDEDVPLLFSENEGNAFTVADVDAVEAAFQQPGGIGGPRRFSAGDLALTLTAEGGTLTLGQTANLDFESGDGTDDNTMTFTGTPAEINDALEGLTYTPLPDLNTDLQGANASVSLFVEDRGQTGTGGNLSQTRSVPITVNAVNDDPIFITNHSFPNLTASEDGTFVLSDPQHPSFVGFSFADVDLVEGNGTLEVSLSLATGNISLSTTNGLTFTEGDGVQDTSMRFTGSLADVNTAVIDSIYSFPRDFNTDGVANIPFVITYNDLGNAGQGGGNEQTHTWQVRINPINDSPLVNVPGAQTVDAGEELPFNSTNGNAITASDFDAQEGNGTVRVFASVDIGSVVFRDDESDIDGSTGIFTNINGIDGFLASLVYTAPASVTGVTNATLTITVNDLANYPTPAQETTRTIPITINPVGGRALEINVPSSLSTDEDTLLTIPGNLLNISYNGSQDLRLELTADNGALLSFSQTNGLQVGPGGASNVASLTAEGSRVDLDAALNQMTVKPVANENTPVSGLIQVTVTISEVGAGSLIDADSFTITVNPVNDLPQIMAPSNISAIEDRTFFFRNANEITFDDIDAGEIDPDSELEVILSVNNGRLSLGTIDGLSFTTGDGVNDRTLVFRGSLDELNTAIGTLSYLGDPDYSSLGGGGIEQLRIEINDLGNTGAPGATSALANVRMEVRPVNDLPTVQVPGTQTGDEDTLFPLAAITVADIDSDVLQVDLRVRRGTITLDGSMGLSFLVGDPTRERNISFTGTLANLNNALASISYQGDFNFNTEDTGNEEFLIVTVSDDLSAGSGGSASVAGTIPIEIIAVNDDPVLRHQAAYAGLEDTPLVISGGNAIGLDDVDAAESNGGPLTIALSVPAGTLTLSQTTGVSIDSGADSSSAMTLSGTVNDLNAALNGLTYRAPANANRLRLLNNAITVQYEDNGNTGKGGGEQFVRTLGLDIVPVNDSPEIQAPLSVNLIRNVPANLSGIVVEDPDVPEGNPRLQVTLTATAGLFDLPSFSGVTFITGDGNEDSRLVLRGAPTLLNAALAGLLFTADGSAPTARLSLSVEDLGYSGGNNLQASDTVTFPVTIPEDSPPDLDVPPVVERPEVAPVIFGDDTGNPIVVGFIDPLSAHQDPIIITLEVEYGCLTIPDASQLEIIEGSSECAQRIVFRAPLDPVNESLQGLVYEPSETDPVDRIEITVEDPTYTGPGNPVVVNQVPIIYNVPDTFENISDRIQLSLSWQLNRQTGGLIATGTVTHMGSTSFTFTTPLYFALEPSGEYRLLSPEGNVGARAEYNNVTPQFITVIPAVGDGDNRLDPGETFTFTGVEVYSRDRSAPPTELFQIWSTVSVGLEPSE